MPIAAAPPAPPSVGQSATVSDSDHDLDPEELDDDEEYEEVEVEEEIEVEVEVSEEEQVEEEEEEEDPEEVEEEEEEEVEEEKVEQGEEVQDEEDPEEEEFGEDLSPIDEDRGKGAISHTDDDSKAPLLDSVILNADTITPLDASVKEAIAAVSVSVVDGLNEEANDISYPKDEKKRKVDQNGDEIISQMEPRSDVLSPALEIKEGKRPAVICDFFAKGWCIKGNLCRFLHVRDHKEESSQQKEGSEASANPKSGNESGEGLIEGVEGSEFSGVADAEASARIPPWDEKESPSWKSGFSERQDLDHPRIEPLKAIERESLRQNSYSDIYGGDKVSSTSTSQLTRQPFSFSSSWTTDPSGTSRHLDDGKELRSSRYGSLHQSSSSLENHSRSYVSCDTLRSVGYRSSMSFSDWEPSVPFRPSYPITQNLLSQYDPFCDSIKQTIIGAKFSRFSSSSQETSNVREHLFSQELSSNKLSHVSPQNICESTEDKNSQGKYLLASKTETDGNTTYEQENETIMTKVDNFLISAHERDMKKASEIYADGDLLLKKNGSQYKETKVDGHSHNNETGFHIKGDTSMQRESRALKLFRGPLIEFVKELVKPTWREGNLSKDAHKMIVKKTVDKVLSSLPPEQIPSTPEDVEMFLCLSRPKIAKVVEAYVEKYGKF